MCSYKTCVKYLSLAVIMIAMFATGGCQSWNDMFAEKKSASIATEMGAASLSKADMLRRQGYYKQAIVEYRKFIDASQNDAHRQHGQIGLAKCLISMRKYPQAVNMLKPLPLEPDSPLQRHMLALAGEALLREDSNEEAESILEIALDNIDKTIQPTEKWQAGCSANLACAYLRNDKPQKAIVFYRFAAKLYTADGNLLAARKSSQMADDLTTILHQYAPYKPIPLTEDLSSGKN